MKLRDCNVVRVHAGLGNQFFCYAFAYALEKKTGKKSVLDLRFVGTPTKYKLENYNITNKKYLVPKGLDDILTLGKSYSKISNFVKDQKIKKLKRYDEKTEGRLDEETFVVAGHTEPVYFKGFWQNSDYFSQYYDEIKNEFTYRGTLSEKTNILLNEITSCNSVSVHVRRGDYVELGADLGIAYQTRAINKMLEAVNNPRFYVFTDDKNWVKENLKDVDYTLVESASDMEDLLLMQKCKHHIVANSTFSWWGAYLADDRRGIVMAPESNSWCEYFYLPDWEVISFLEK